MTGLISLQFIPFCHQRPNLVCLHLRNVCSPLKRKWHILDCWSFLVGKHGRKLCIQRLQPATTVDMHLSGGRLKGGGGSQHYHYTCLGSTHLPCSSSMDPDAGPPPSSIFRSSRWRERPSDLAFKPCWNISDYQTNVKTINKGLLGYGIEIVHVMHTETR